jgi:serine/threonine-protein kinase HipA
LALSVAEYFDLKPDEANSIAADTGKAVSAWRTEAKKVGISHTEINRMASAFDHEDLRKATTLANRKTAP